MTSTTLVPPTKCPKCGGVQMNYQGRAWCAPCEATGRRVLNVLRWFLTLCQWGMVVSLPIAVVMIMTIAPLKLDHGRLVPSPPMYWWVQLGPCMFLSTCAGLLIGRILTELIDRTAYSRIPTGLIRWYEPAAMLKDLVLIALGLTLVYAPLLLLFLSKSNASQIPIQYTEAHRQEYIEYIQREWWLNRAPLIAPLFLIVLYLFNFLHLINLDTLAPRTKLRIVFVLGYVGLVLKGFLLFQPLMTQVALAGLSPNYLRISMGIFLFCTVMTILLVAVSFYVGRSLGPPLILPAPATIAMVGPPTTGKTVYLARAYTLLDTQPWEMASLVPTPESRRELEPIVREIEKDRKWPQGTVNPSNVPFLLQMGIQDMIQFNWLDVAGRAFTEPDDPVFKPQWEDFLEHLRNADAVVMMVDARDLVAPHVNQFAQVLHAKIYKRVTDEYYRRLIHELGQGARPVPLAVVVTQTCRLTASMDRLRCHRMVQGMVDYWIRLAKNHGLPTPPVRVFLTSAVITPDPQDNSIPVDGILKSEATIESILWLSAQILRNNVGLMDSAVGFLKSSRLQQEALRLEALSTKCD